MEPQEDQIKLLNLSQKHQFINNVLVEKVKQNQYIYYLPCCVSLKIKTINDINMENRKAKVAGTLTFRFYYGILDPKIIDQFIGGMIDDENHEDKNASDKEKQKKKAILLQFPQEIIQLKQEKDINFVKDQEEPIISIMIRKDFVCELKEEIFLTPFEIMNLFLVINVKTIILDPKHNNKNKILIKFNCMSDRNTKLLTHSQKYQYGNYRIAPNFFDTQYKNTQKNSFQDISFIKSKKDQKKFKPQKQAEFILQNPERTNIRVNQARNDTLVRQIRTLDDNRGNIEKTKKSLNNMSLFQQNHKLEEFKMEQNINSPNNNQKQQKQKKKDLLISTKSQKQGLHKKEKDHVRCFQYVHFRITLYKHPKGSLFFIFIPLWILGFINLLIFFQSRDLTGRIGVIAVLAVGYIAFIPSIYSQIPQSSSLKLVEILILMEIATNMICLTQSLLGKDNIQPYDWRVDGFFIVSVIIHLSTISIVFLLLVVHKFYWSVQYQIDKKQVKRDRREQWCNQQSQNYFQQYINNKQNPRDVRILMPDMIQQK